MSQYEAVIDVTGSGEDIYALILKKKVETWSGDTDVSLTERLTDFKR